MRTILLLLTLHFFIGSTAQVKPLREQAVMINEVLADRFNNLLPTLMDKANIDCWVLITREYNEDPIIKTMLPAEWLSARRRTILVFYRNKQKQTIEKYAVARYPVGKEIKAAWDVDAVPNQWEALVALLRKLNPSKIGINTSVDFGHADGLDHTEYLEFMNVLNVSEQSKVVSAQALAVSWLETRTEKEMQLYPSLLKITHAIIKEGFSNKVIKPNVTTTQDLVWWFRQQLNDKGLTTWFHPSIEIQRRVSNENDQVIRPGDFLHVDFGITYLRLNSDVQEQAYVLLPTEKTVPENLQAAFTKTNQLQDFLTNEFALGKSGNTILKQALTNAKAAGINPSIYTHPIGFHGHAAGTTIGMWDFQNGVPGSGDYTMKANTCYSIELNATHTLAGWDKPVRVALEQNGIFNGSSFEYIDGRQTKIHAIQPK
jgi:Xaa-Pro aminopeptidase